MNYVGKWKESALQLINGLAGSLLSYLIANVPNVDLSALLHDWLHSGDSVMLKQHDFNSEWNELLDTALTMRQVKRVLLNSKPITLESTFCNHHVNCTIHEGFNSCLCCGFRCKDDYCLCCSPKIITHVKPTFDNTLFIDNLIRLVTEAVPAEVKPKQSTNYERIKSNNNIEWHSHMCPDCSSITVHAHVSGNSKHAHALLDCANKQCKNHSGIITNSMILSEFQSKSDEFLSANYKLKPIVKASQPQKLSTIHEEIHKFDANSSKIVRDLHYSEEIMSEVLDIDYVYFTQHVKDYHQA